MSGSLGAFGVRFIRPPFGGAVKLLRQFFRDEHRDFDSRKDVRVNLAAGVGLRASCAEKGRDFFVRSVVGLVRHGQTIRPAFWRGVKYYFRVVSADRSPSQAILVRSSSGPSYIDQRAGSSGSTTFEPSHSRGIFGGSGNAATRRSVSEA